MYQNVTLILFSRCSYSSDIWKKHYCWWNTNLLLSFCWSWFGSPWNDTYQWISWCDRMHFWWGQWSPSICKDCWAPGNIHIAKIVTKLKIFLKCTHNILWDFGVTLFCKNLIWQQYQYCIKYVWNIKIKKIFSDLFDYPEHWISKK